MITSDIIVVRPAAQNVAPGVALPAGPQGVPGKDGAPGSPGASGLPGTPGAPGPTTIAGLTDASDQFKALNVPGAADQRKAMGAAAANDAFLTGQTQTKDHAVDAKQSFSLTPTAQPAPFAASRTLTGSIGGGGLSAAEVIDIVMNSGGTETGYNRAKLSSYRGASATAGAGDIGVDNQCLTEQSGHNGHCLVDEFNLNTVDTYPAPDAAGAGPIKAFNYYAGIGGKVQAIWLVNLNGGTLNPYRGMGIYGGALRGPVIEAQGASHFAYLGGTYTCGIDTRTATITTPTYFLRQGQVIAWATAANVQGPSILTNAGDTLILTAASGIAVANTISGTDGTQNLGLSNIPFNNLYIKNNPIVGSDAKLKTAPQPLPAALLAALREIDVVWFQYLTAVAEKGEDAARQHVGVIAQQVVAACEKHDVDAFRWGFIGKDADMAPVTKVRKVERGITDTITETVVEETEVDGRFVQQRVERTREDPRMVPVPVVDADGKPVMVRSLKDPLHPEVGKGDELVPDVRWRQATETVDESYVVDEPTGTFTLSVRYEQLAMAMIAALRAA